MTPSEKYFYFILTLVKENIWLFLASIITTLYLDYIDFFGQNSSEIYYLVFSLVFLFVVLVTIRKYRNPLQYSPKYVFFVKDRNDSLVKMKPYLDPWVIKLGLINPKEIVNIRYSMYPDLDLGLDLDPNTGIITGYPMELGNHVSEVKMKFLGGTYSTTVRVESVETLKEKMLHKRDEFAPPRTVAQLLIREEDLLKREKDLDYDMAKRQKILEEEYKSKEMGLKELLSLEKQKSKKEVDEIKKDHDSQLAEMVESLQDKEREIVKSERELEESRTLMKEFGITTQNRESEEEPEEEVVEEEPEEEPEEEIVEEESDEEVVEEEPEEVTEEEVVEEEPEEEPEEEVVEEEPEEEPEEEVVEEEPEEEPEEEAVEEEPEEEPEEEVVEEEPEEEDEEYDYVSMTKAELVELAKKRGLPVSGTKKKIISRLEKD